ncbi:MAG: hypothetical protein JWP01_195 [Myxococcales bacterium]|nr:hypothetical protein [Myxococcales bacterium]
MDAPALDSTPGDGTCLAPQPISLGFTATAGASTAQQLDIAMPECVPGLSLSESVYALRLSDPTSVHITASDRSGQGVAVQVRSDTCSGASVACDWADNGAIDRNLSLPAGTWVYIVERRPAGPFTFAVMP